MPTTSQDMVIIHRVFRREFRIMPDIVRMTEVGDSERVAVLALHLRLLLGVLNHHHEGEDLLLWPRLRDRAPDHVALFDAMNGDHLSLHADLAQLDEMVDAWRDSGGAVERDRLADALAAIGGPLAEHLDHEEREVLPLVDKHFTPEEWGELGQRAFSLLQPNDALTVLAQMNEDSPDAEWSAFFGHLPPPVQEAYLAHGVPAYPGYVAAVRG